MDSAIRAYFPAGSKGDRAYEHLVTTLVRQESRKAGAPRQICEGLWAVGETLCLFSGKDRAFRDSDRKFAKESGATRLLVTPGAGPPHAELMKALPHGCRTIAVTDSELSTQLNSFEPYALRYGGASPTRKKFEQIRFRYDAELAKLHGKIQFVGMSVYKVEASEGIPIKEIYIPLRVAPEGASEHSEGVNPLDLLSDGGRHVFLGDPGSGKSTLLRFIALAGTDPGLTQKYGSSQDGRLCVYVAFRRYGDALRTAPNLSLVDFIVQIVKADFGLKDVSAQWLEYYLYARDAVLLLDGLDELPDAKFKRTVRDKVGELLDQYPGNTVILSSRIVGYEKDVRYDKLGFSHHRVARLNPADIEKFVHRWYSVRIDNPAERTRHAHDLIQIVRGAASTSIRELAENPLLLTIICLVHRIDAVLPDVID